MSYLFLNKKKTITEKTAINDKIHINFLTRKIRTKKVGIEIKNNKWYLP